MSIAPRDIHEAQVQFALERGLPAMLGILSIHRLPFPSRSFDMAHCSRCLVPWTDYDGLYLSEIDREHCVLVATGCCLDHPSIGGPIRRDGKEERLTWKKNRQLWKILLADFAGRRSLNNKQLRCGENRLIMSIAAKR
ncbi:hypothetical protein Sjap_019336 [Stephania japonica]|uniref:Methyltransferase n=1 Tax=Stephania japonica TaxID=461633 RepID=A0AAP0F1E4_9MAGN